MFEAACIEPEQTDSVNHDKPLKYHEPMIGKKTRKRKRTSLFRSTILRPPLVLPVSTLMMTIGMLIDVINVVQRTEETGVLLLAIGVAQHRLRTTDAEAPTASQGTKHLHHVNVHLTINVVVVTPGTMMTTDVHLGTTISAEDAQTRLDVETGTNHQGEAEVAVKVAGAGATARASSRRSNSTER